MVVDCFPRCPPLTRGVVAAAVRGFRLVEVGGLKAVLPVFMGRGAARKLRQKVKRKPCTRQIIKLSQTWKRESRAGMLRILIVSFHVLIEQ